MTRNEFNIGDKVRLKEFPGMNPYYKGRVCEIAGIDNNGYVTFKEGGIRPQARELELIEPLDRKTAFLTELQALLRKYDATIAISPYYEYSAVLSLYMEDKAVIREKEVENITADNIMDFDKE